MTYTCALLLTALTVITGCNEVGSNSSLLPDSGTNSPVGSAPPPTPPQTPKAILNRDGEFLVSNSSNHNFAINIPIVNGTVISQIILDVDIYVSNWDSQNPGGYHCLFWMQKGTWPRSWQWENNVIGYMNLRGPQQSGGRMALETTTNGNYNQAKRYGATTGRWYHLQYTLNARNGNVSYAWSADGNTEISLQTGLYANPIQVTNGGFFVQFGSQVAEEGPEAKTYGWRFANLKFKAY